MNKNDDDLQISTSGAAENRTATEAQTPREVVFEFLTSLAFSLIIFVGIAIVILSFPVLTEGNVAILEATLQGRRRFSALVDDVGNYDFIGSMATIAIAMTVSLNSSSRSGGSLGLTMRGEGSRFDRNTLQDGVAVATLWAMIQVVGGLCVATLIAGWGDQRLVGKSIALTILIAFLMVEASRALVIGRGGVADRNPLPKGAVDELREAADSYDSNLAAKSSRLWWICFTAALVIGSSSRSLWALDDVRQVVLTMAWTAFVGGAIFLAFSDLAREFVREQIFASRASQLFTGSVSCFFVLSGSSLYFTLTYSMGEYRETGQALVNFGFVGMLIAWLILTLIGIGAVLGTFGIGPFRHNRLEVLHQSSQALISGSVQVKRYFRRADLRPRYLIVPGFVAIGLLILVWPGVSWVSLRAWVAMTLMTALLFYRSRFGFRLGSTVCLVMALIGCALMMLMLLNQSAPIPVQLFLMILLSSIAICATIAVLLPHTSWCWRNFSGTGSINRLIFESFDRCVMQRRLSSAVTICRDLQK